MNSVRPRKMLYGFIRLGFAGGLLFLISWALLGLTRLMVVALPQSWIRSLLGTSGVGDPVIESLTARQERRARKIGQSVTTASRHTPWKSECYPQALSARVELVTARVPHTVSFGLRRDEDGRLLAHAWVSAGDIRVTGGDPHHFTVVGSFAWKPGT